MTDNITLPRDAAYQVPLHELLESVPSDARLVIDYADGRGTAFIPVGRYCHEAATALRTALAAEQPKPSDSLKAMKEAFRILTKPESGDLRWQVSDACDILRTAIRAAPPALVAEPVKPITVPKTVPLPPITCGFVDVRFDGEGWFCDKCGKRMSADFETSVKRGSSEKCYLELMQRKAEAVRTMSERNMK